MLLAIFAAVFVALFLHPYITYPLTLKFLREKPIKKGDGESLPSATLVFCAYNEERSLPSKIENLEAIKALNPEIEFMAYADLCSDQTVPMLKSRPDLLTAVAATERTGKAFGMRTLVSMIKSDIIIFTDANVLLDPESVKPMLRYFADPDVGGVAGCLHYINAGESVTAGVGSAYWRLEESIKRLESRCGSIMGADGSIFALRRAHYPEVPPHLLDDMISSMGMIFAGLRLVSAPDVVAYERNTTASADEFRRKRRIACRAFNSHKHVWPQVAALGPAMVYKYLSHKVLRWLGALWLFLAALFGALALVAWGLGWLALAGLVLAPALFWLGARRNIPGLTAVVEILTSIGATFVGVVDSFRGQTYQTWTPAASR